MGEHSRRDVFEPDRDFVAFLAQSPGQTVEQMRRGQVPDDAALPAADLVEIPVDEQQQVVGRDVFAALVDDGDPVGVPVGGHAQVVAALVPNAGDEDLEGRQIGRRRASAK